jgi:structural maintenance of chromosomes protein 6
VKDRGEWLAFSRHFLFIKAHSVAEVTIQIKNQGDEAFKPHEYGQSITITRKFSKDGASSWKIKGKDGKVISTKKEELSAICDHMNIQVDNPLNVLTQGKLIETRIGDLN